MNYHPTEEKDLELQRMAPQRGEELCELIENELPAEENLRLEVTFVLPGNPETLLRVGLPAILSIYFDVFSGLMQAFIFAMLTMLNISGAVPWDDWNKKRERRGKQAVAAN